MSVQAFCDFTDEFWKHLDVSFNKDWHIPYLYLTQDDLKQNVICFRFPGCTVGHIVISNADSQDIETLSSFVVDDITLYDLPKDIVPYDSKLTQDYLYNMFANTTQLIRRDP